MVADGLDLDPIQDEVLMSTGVDDIDCSFDGNKEALAMFNELDQNADGRVDYEELSARMSDLGVPDDEIEQLFMRLDLDNNGTIDNAEWVRGYNYLFDLSAQADFGELTKPEAGPVEAMMMFHSLDRNDDRLVDCTELSGTMNDLGVSDAQIETFMLQMDTNGDGMLDVQEWVRGYSCFTDASRFAKFKDLRGAGYSIKDTALRAISLMQFEKIYAHIEQQVHAAPWRVTRFKHKERTRINLSDPKLANLYDVAGNTHQVKFRSIF